MSRDRSLTASSRALWPSLAGLPDLYPGDAVHLIGIGGAGMSGLARVLAALGLRVSGSDRDSSPATRALAAEGIALHIGHHAAALPPRCRLVIHSPAVPADNPELVAAQAAGIAVAKRAPLLGALMDARFGVAVSGTHGKTTTSGWLAWVLDRAGLDPSFFVGGELPDLGANARLGRGPFLVVEADEYDRTFLHGHPRLALVTNIEHDHPDFYPTFDEVLDAFRAFLALIPETGLVIANAASPGVLEALPAARASTSLYHVSGDPEPPPGTAIDWRAVNLTVVDENQHFDLVHGVTPLGSWQIRLPGRHNVGNALAVIAAASALGLSPETTRPALAAYRGAARRFELRGRAGFVTVVDDYAHHPSEIAATLVAAGQRFPAGRILVVVQPHTYSRLAAMAEAFAAALATADWVAVTPVYAARELPRPDASPAALAASLPQGVVAPDLDAAAELAAAVARPGDAVLFLGAGDIPRASRACLDRLRQDVLQALVQRAQRAGLGGSPLKDCSLADFTSLKVGGPAHLLVRVHDLADLAAWWCLAQEIDAPVRVLGRGSNVLASDAGLRALVLVNRCEGWHLVPAADGATAEVIAESGVGLAALAQSLARAGWSGLEAGVGIPGSLGAALVTNAGAHGWEIADNLIEATLLDTQGHSQVWQAESLELGYRTSRLKGDPSHLVLSLRLAVRRQDPAEIRSRIAGLTASRRASQPTDPSVGSMFKNPPGDYAGRLIEAAGLKGYQVGQAMISAKHANFFVNLGGARAVDVEALITQAQGTVLSRFGVRLELEIERIGDVDAA